MISLLKWLMKKVMNSYFRWKIIKTVAEFKSPLTVNGKTILNKKTVLGKNVNFNGLIIGGEGNVVIGDNFHSGEDCLIITQNHNYNSGTAIPYDSESICKNIVIGDNVWIGSRVIILGGVTIGEGAVIQAGAVVTSNIEECGVAGGNPARVFKYRDKLHYEKLKLEKKFH